MANYYDILGVSKDAGEKEIRQAFRSAARKYHPDLNPGDQEGEAKFKRINEAYEVLSDPESRKRYDRYGDQWKHADEIEAQFGRGRVSDDLGFDLFGGLEDLLGQFGGRGGRRGGSATKTRIDGALTVTLEQAFSGTRSHVTFPSRDGERRIEVTIPPGVDTDSVVHVSPDGNSDLYLNITVSPHPRFQRKGNDLYTEVEVPFEDVLLGGETQIQTLTKRVRLKVPPGSQNGQRIRLARQGMPKLGATETKGDLYVTLRPTLPKNLTEDEKDLIRRFKELRSQKR